MERLRNENDRLNEANYGLSSQNLKLMRSLNEQETSRCWTSFDIVEEHYRQLEHHKSMMESEQDLENSFNYANHADVAAVLPAATPVASPTRSEMSLKALPF